MNELEVENQEVQTQEPSLPVVEMEEKEHSLLDKIYAGEVDYKSLDPATKTTVKKEWESGLDERQKYLHKMGWVDKPFFNGFDKNGNPIEWKTAEEFEKILSRPYVKRERESHLMIELEKSKKEIERLTKLTKMNLERNLQNDEMAIDARIKDAKENFDPEALEKALEDKRKFQANKEEVKQYYEAPKPTNPQPTEQEIIAQMPEDLKEAYFDFKGKNLWFGLKSEPELNQFAEQEWNSIQYAPNMNEKQKFDYISQRVRQAFPSKFPKQQTNYMPTTNAVTNKPILKPEQKAAEGVYEKLPQRDKEKISSLIASGKFANREAVLKNFGLI